MEDKNCIRFVPSGVEGLPDVAEVIVRPDRLEVLSQGHWLCFRLADIARWPRPTWLWRALYRLGWRPRWLPVADRDWFQRPPERFFSFYTKPRLVVRMPVDEPPERGRSTFLRAQQALWAGGFHTFDLG
jgi:hypothetical protein